MLQFEREQREQDSADEARAIAVQLMSETPPNVEMGVMDLFVRVDNHSARPALRPRMRITDCSGTRWGPQLISSMAPGAYVELHVRLPNVSGLIGAQVRFYDIHDRAWVALNTGTTVAIDDDVTEWIPSPDVQAALLAMTDLERGMIDGTVTPSFDEWRADFGDEHG